MKHIFLDTNIFIHFRPYDQIPWREIVEDDYRLVVAPIVLDELDKHKTNSNKKIASRVKTVLPKIEQEQTNQDSIMTVNLSVPKDATFNQNDLSRSQQDHALLAAILEFGEANGLDNIVFVSHDTGPRIRARALGISVIQLDNKYLLPEEESPEEKELKKLQKENAELKNKMPDVVLSFSDGEKFVKYNLNPIELSEDAYCSVELMRIKEQYKPFVTEEEESIELPKGPVPIEFLMANKKLLNSLSRLNEPTTEQKEKYNQELENFYSEYETLFKNKYQWDRILSNVVQLDLAISNKGTAPADEIDIFVVFPSTTKILLYENFHKFEKPKPPYKPKFEGDMDMSGIAVNFWNNQPPKEYIRIIDKSVIKDTVECSSVTTLDDGSIEVHYNYSDSLKHNFNFSLEPIWAFSESSFKIKYRLLISNYPKQVEGELNIIINK
jgi:rRNA-processing protein FCF1